MDGQEERKVRIALMLLEKASKGRKITKPSIQKLIETGRTHIQFAPMLASVNELLEDVFGLSVRPLNDGNDGYIVLSRYRVTCTPEDAPNIRIIDFVRFPVLAMITACINHSPLGKIDLAEFKAAAGESVVVQEIKQETGLNIDNMVKMFIDAGYFAIEDDVRGSQALVKGPRLALELTEEHVLETQFQDMLDRLRQGGAARRPSPLGANTSA